jgi:iron(III) transport system permease protein
VSTTTGDRPAAATRRHRTTPATGALMTAAVLVTAVSVLPIVVVVVNALGQGWSEAVSDVLRPRVGELLRNTVSLVVVATSACAVLGVGCAWLVERARLPGAGWWRVLLVAPLAVPAFVNAYAWVSLRPSLTGLGGASLITTLSYFPLVFLPVSAALRGLDRSWEDTARSLGVGPWRTFARIVLPQLRPAVLGGCLLVALHLLAEFGVLAMLQFPTFTTAILDQYEAAFDTGTGSVLAVVLVALCVTVLTIEYFWRGRRGHARIGAGVIRRPEPAALGRWLVPSMVAMAALVLLALGVPVYSLGHWLAAPGATVDAAALGAALASTVGLALAAAVVACVAAFPVALLLRRRQTLLTTSIERLCYLASSLPGVVVGLALVLLTIRWVTGLYQSATLLVLAYVILFLPRALVSIRTALAQAPSALLESARALGDSPARAVVRVVVPLASPGILAGVALVFMATTTELTATLLLAPTGTRTLATGFWSASSSLDYGTAAPYAVAMVLLSAPMTWFLLRQRTVIA